MYLRVSFHVYFYRINCPVVKRCFSFNYLQEVFVEGVALGVT